MGKALIIKGADFSRNGITEEYQRLAWIGASNTNKKHIASGLYFGNNVGNLNEELEFSVTLDRSKLDNPTSGTCYSMGSGMNNPTNVKVWFQGGACACYFSSDNSTGTNRSVFKSVSGSLWDNQPHTIKLNKHGGTIDNNTFTFDFEPNLDGLSEGAITNAPIYLDCYSKYGSGNNDVVASQTEDAEKIHWVKYRRDGELVLDAIPVKRNSDGKVGFYDRISGELLLRNDDSTPVYGE